MQTLYYTAHHNWSWVLDVAVASFGEVEVIKKARMKLLPSQRRFTIPRGYALFRVETMQDDDVESIVWCTSSAFGFLDPKDALFNHLQWGGAEHCMPQTRLIPYDCEDFDMLSNSRMLLKAALGSGGDSLYFVTNKEQVLHVIRSHAAKAQNTPNFTESLIELYGKVPSWSLQELLTSYLPGMQQKCQIRAYVIAVGRHLYLYTSYEVRFPHWKDDDGATTTPYVSADLAFCGDSGAVPYNANRSKASTERYVLDEVCSDDAIASNITTTMHRAFAALRTGIEEKMDEDAHLMLRQWGTGTKPSPALLAVAGVDLLLDNYGMPKIVELNNNPAMPQPHKHMTTRYRDHLVHMVRGIISLGIDHTNFEKLGFELIW